MKPKLMVVGGSLGGADALCVVLGGLPAGLSAPVVVVLHRDRSSCGTLCAALQRACALPVAEPHDKAPIAPGCVYLAPPDYHLLLDREGFALSTEAPVRGSRPSIDVLFESAADLYGDGVLAMLLSGSNDDGALGVTRIKARGGRVVAQDPATAESPIMPAAAAPLANWILPLEGMPKLLARLFAEGGSEA